YLRERQEIFNKFAHLPGTVQDHLDLIRRARRQVLTVVLEKEVGNFVGEAQGRSQVVGCGVRKGLKLFVDALKHGAIGPEFGIQRQNLPLRFLLSRYVSQFHQYEIRRTFLGMDAPHAQLEHQALLRGLGTLNLYAFGLKVVGYYRLQDGSQPGVDILEGRQIVDRLVLQIVRANHQCAAEGSVGHDGLQRLVKDKDRLGQGT
ncbi:MAG: hypothetical protein ABL994_25220, partial [Verrucomicrobiales bacterium]